MKWFRVTSAVIATLGLTTAAHAGLFDLFKTSGSSKSCGCAPCYQPQGCKPTITKPCCPNIYTFQRKLSCLKPPCCDTCGAPRGCCQAAGPGCVKPCGPGCPPTCAAPAGCAPAAAPVGCAPAAAPAPACAAPIAAPAACAPACAPTCAAPANCAPAAAPGHCAPGCQPTCAAPVAPCAPKGACCPQQGGCCSKRGGWFGRGDRCCDVDPCKLAKLIYKSQTACYAKDRRNAIHKLGDKYDCTCSPEIMSAFIYALNDADERVREKAADEIGDQLRRNRCCCTREVIAALTAALGDCDRGVRRQAEEALAECGYDVVKGCCECVSCNPCDCNYGGPRPWMKGGGAPPAPAGNNKNAAPPAPGTEKVYFPAKLRSDRPKSRARLANLFGLLN